jgi:hypothetical protein
MSKTKVTATTGICGHLNVPPMASLTPHKERAYDCKTIQNATTSLSTSMQHSLGMTTENNKPNNLRERNQQTWPSLRRQQPAIALLITYLTGFSIYTDVYIVTLTFYIDMYTEVPKTENSIYPYKNEHATGILML